LVKLQFFTLIEIEVDPDKICNKLDYSDYDHCRPVLTENRSPAWITSWQNTGWAKKLSIYRKWQICTSKMSTCAITVAKHTYTTFTSPFDNMLKLICHKLPKMLSSPITIDGKPTPHSTHGKAHPHQENAVNSSANCTGLS